MRNYKHYNMRLTTLTPVFIGSGEKIGKKEFIYDPARMEISIPNLFKMSEYLRRMGMENAYESYIRDSGNKLRLGEWFERQRGNLKFIKEFEGYCLDFDSDEDLKDNRGKLLLNDIATFIKDPYGKAYVPGSSIKGMIRTALLSYEVMHNETLKDMLLRIERANSNAKASEKVVKGYLKKEIEELETLVFNTLNNNSKKQSDALNSNMKGLIISDSRPLDINSLTLSKKVDEHIDGNQNALPIFRESLRAGIDIDFELSIDETVFPYSIDDIFKALKCFNDISNEYFYSKFEAENQGDNIVYLGGGVGFLSKTVIYAAFAKKGKAVEMTDNIFKMTLGKNYKIHKHHEDIANGVSPHTCKCTYYNGYTENMGLCELKILS